ncbi:nuclear GTPase SLIP-GC-like [Labrus mixtus]|uniref:nuclear GTPase SLIP-GC-like n=1 Tax=Labrus mixtus TaxID=508554 RepID=UPI0029C0C10C|nr:nuclear GTPase SLIP-GC-like [Labrus mixtus]XP_060921722.1 nuclear GTPase SLIP-GC-like [Labrus mixtus]XP_060921723.1 nuclear GTPase SLIP-GC-like [Labrus mixtus]
MASLPKKPRRDKELTGEDVLPEVEKIMASVESRLPQTELKDFLKKKIGGLKKEKRELVGVFGKTGAGKSSLINAVIGEDDLLPSGSYKACTTVIIKVEANKQNQNYEAEIEFITEEEFEEDVQGCKKILQNDADDEEENGDERDNADKINFKEVKSDAVEMLSAVYGEQWKEILDKNDLMNRKHFKEIPQFLSSKKKILSFRKAEELSAELVKYTRSRSKARDGKVKTWFWPLVKCVTIRVPNNDLLQNVTLVDLPGNGDRNKSRDEMWKGVVGRCSTVWIVAEINRAASEKEAWEILNSSLIGNGGQCQHIHFICTKSDQIGRHKGQSLVEAIRERNEEVKVEVKDHFKEQRMVTRHFSDECFKVFTVSANEFQDRTFLEPADTEVPELQKILQELNDCHSETLNYWYVSGAYGILSLIQGARCGGGATVKTEVSKVLTETMKCGHKEVQKSMQEATDALEECLKRGVENSKSSCDDVLESFICPEGGGSGFHKTLKCVIDNYGVHKTTKGKHLNLNEDLAAKLMDSIDDEFRKTFPTESNLGPFNGTISSFSLDTGKLIKNQKYKDVELQLEFLRTEEEKIKIELQETIRQRKKEIYSGLTTTIKETMQTCYEDAQKCEGKGRLKNTRQIIRQHVDANKNTMFEKAKAEMMSKLENLKEEILKKLNDTMKESIERALNSDGRLLPDVKEELETVTKYYQELKIITDEGTSPVSADQPGPSSAQVYLMQRNS